MRMEGIVTESELMEVAGLKQRAALRRHLRRAGIPFKVLNGRILTTRTALDAALVGREKKEHRGPNLDAITTKGAG
jgi:hypothetical protein